jgi:hypothetical protein
VRLLRVRAGVRMILPGERGDKSCGFFTRLRKVLKVGVLASSAMLIISLYFVRLWIS